MRVLQKFAHSPQGPRSFCYRRKSDAIQIFDSNQNEIADIDLETWNALIARIEAAPKNWFVVTDNERCFDDKQVLYKIAALSSIGGHKIPESAFFAIGPILLNEGTLFFYQGAVKHERDFDPSLVARIYLTRGTAS